MLTAVPYHPGLPAISIPVMLRRREFRRAAQAISKTGKTDNVRAIIVVLDSLGIGASDDAASYGDECADTFGHIVEAAARGGADLEGVRSGPLNIPNLTGLGFVKAAEASRGCALDLPVANEIAGVWGFAAEQSFGKDTPSGHWEMAGLPVCYDWRTFEEKEKSFPEALLSDLVREAGLPGVLGNCHASGTVIIEELGPEHLRSGSPIVYTSADSVMQIAAHEDHFGLERLYDVCAVARTLVDEYNVGRVIARPFVGSVEEGFMRTGNRRDYAMPPHDRTLLDYLIEAGGSVVSIGKVSDIFAHQGFSKTVKAHGNSALFDALLAEVSTSPDNTLLFSNFVDFDTLYGHRRDVAGYAGAIEAFDTRLPELLAALQETDFLVITADHGCDPTTPGSDHTREHVPAVCFGPSLAPGYIGKRASFADIGQSIADHFGLPALPNGVSFLRDRVEEPGLGQGLG